MLRETFLNLRTRHSEQPIRQLAEGLKFFRRTAHVASMIAPLVVFAFAASAQVQKQSDQPKNPTAVADQNNERQMRAIADELKAIREQDAKRNSDPTPHGNERWFGDKAPEWSNWILAIIAAVGGFVAYRAFTHERDAVRLTERADVLFVNLKLLNPRTNAISEDVLPWSVIIAVQKNFGRTTATDVRVRWRFFIEGDPIPDIPFLPPAVVGAGAELETRMGSNMQAITGNRFNQVALREVTLRGIGELTYTDVFGKGHRATFRGTFRQGEAGAGAFAIDTEDRE